MPEVKLIVNEKKIPLKDVMQSILANIIDGFVSALNDVPEERDSISIKIKF